MPWSVAVIGLCNYIFKNLFFHTTETDESHDAILKLILVNDSHKVSFT